MKNYRNSQRTKKWIRNAFTELISEKGSISKITVSELAERADITKTTFYYHYDDLYAVAEEFENELIDELNVTLNNVTKENPDDHSKYINRIISFIKLNETNYRLAANASDFNYFTTKLKNVFLKKISLENSLSGFSSDKEKRKIQVCFLVSACVDTIVQYLKGDLCTSLDIVGEVIAEAIDKLKNN